MINIERIIFLIVYIASMLSFWLWHDLTITDMQLKIESEKADALANVRELEKQKQIKINEIENENIKKERELKLNYENTINDLTRNYNIVTSRVHCKDTSSTDMRRKNTDTTEIKCYTERELFERIERSLAIAERCDKLANDYNALLKICKL